MLRRELSKSHHTLEMCDAYKVGIVNLVRAMVPKRERVAANVAVDRGCQNMLR